LAVKSLLKTLGSQCFLVSWTY